MNLPMTDATRRVSEQAQAIADRLIKHLRDVTGLKQPYFVLVIYTDGRATFVRDLDRNSTLVTLAALLARWGAEPRGVMPADVVMNPSLIWPLTQRQLHKLQHGAAAISARLSDDIAAVAGQAVAWSLVMPTPHHPSYMGSCDRADATRELGDLLEMLLEGMPEVPAHEFQ